MKPNFNKSKAGGRKDNFFKKNPEPGKFKSWKKDDRNGGDKKFGKPSWNKNDRNSGKGQGSWNKNVDRSQKSEDGQDSRKFKNTKPNNFIHKSQKDKDAKMKFKPKENNDKQGFRQYSNDRPAQAEQQQINQRPKFEKKMVSFEKNDSEEEERNEKPVVKFVFAPEILEQKIAQLEEYEKKHRVVNKREEYLKRKQRKEEILKQKTRKGQPVMAGRMQLLYEKIQKTVGTEKKLNFD